MQAIYDFIAQLPILPIILVLAIVWYLINSFFIVYHLIRFGIGPKPKIIAFVFLAGSWALLIVAIMLYHNVDLTSFWDFVRSGQWFQLNI